MVWHILVLIYLNLHTYSLYIYISASHPVFHRDHGDRYLWDVIIPIFFLFSLQELIPKGQKWTQQSLLPSSFLHFSCQNIFIYIIQKLVLSSHLFPKKCSILKVLITLIFSTWIMLLDGEKRFCLPGPPCLVVCTGSQIRHCLSCLPPTTLQTFSNSIMFPATLWTLYKCVKYWCISSTITFYTNIVTIWNLSLSNN